MVILTVEVMNARGLTLDEIHRAIDEDDTATLEMPGWGSAPAVKILSVETDE